MKAPKPLNQPLLARLLVVGRGYRKGFMPSFRDQPAFTQRLADMGLVEASGGKVAKTGRVIRHADALPTPAGLEVLASMPGADFDEFRAKLGKADA